MSISEVLAGSATWALEIGDCLNVLKALPDESVDAVVTDPPAGIGFMGRDWDGDKGGRDNWIAWLQERMAEAVRVLKPGGHALVWALPRTSHWTATAIEDAGFEVRDCLTHNFGTGFPKSLSVSKAIDASQRSGRCRPEDMRRIAMGDDYKPSGRGRVNYDHGGGSAMNGATSIGPVTDAAKQWEGWGTALKPSSEHWILARKPMTGTVAVNVQRHGVGALNIDASRVAANNKPLRVKVGGASTGVYGDGLNNSKAVGTTDVGRWPPNTLFSHGPGCRQSGNTEIKKGDARAAGHELGRRAGGFGDVGGDETIPVFECDPSCPVAEVDRQSGDLKGGGALNGDEPGNRNGGSVYGRGNARGAWQPHDSGGGASRFFPTFEFEAADFFPFRYVAKPSQQERNAGLGKRNEHVTVKSIALMRWLVTLITPPNGVVLDMFAGSGTTLIAALRGGFRCIGVELEAKHGAIIERRVSEDAPLFNRVAK